MATSKPKRVTAPTEAIRTSAILQKVEYISPDTLKPNPHNPRFHPRHQIKKIGRSIQSFGFNNPILVGDNNQIIAGHGRWQAAKFLKIPQIPVLRINHLSDVDVQAYLIADNRLAEGARWDEGLLAINFETLGASGVDVDLTGFEMPEIEFYLDKQTGASGGVVEDAPPAYDAGRAVTSDGDVFELGHHRVVCGDARDYRIYENLLAGTKAKMIFTDPPYNVPIVGHVSGLGRNKHSDFAMACGELSPLEFKDFLGTVLSLTARFSEDGSIHYVCMDWRHQKELLEAGHDAYDELKQVCIWVKPNGGMGSFYRSRYEMIFVWKHGRAAHTNNFRLGQYGRSRTNVWEYAGMSSFGSGRDEQLALHPTCKPVGLVADALKDCSNRDDIVLDPFGGSGSTVMAAEQTHRQARLIEIDPRYCDVIIRRWQNHTGIDAIHLASGKTFNEISRSRTTSRAIKRKDQKV